MRKEPNEKELCQKCQQFLSKDFESWEKNKLKVKSEAKYCEHTSNFSGVSQFVTYYNKDNEILMKLGHHGSGGCLRRCKDCDYTITSDNYWEDFDEELDHNHKIENGSIVHINEFIKGQCKKCSNSNVWINSGENCFPCDTIQKKLEMGVMIKSAGLEQCRLNWHNTKSEREKGIKQNKHVETELRQLFSEIDAVLGLETDIPQPNQNNQALIVINQVEQLFTVNRIKKIEKQGNQLIITFDDENVNDTLTNEQEEFLNTFLTDNNLTSLNINQLQELRNNLNNQIGKPTNYIPWILGGIGIAVVLGIIIFVIIKSLNKSKIRK